MNSNTLRVASRLSLTVLTAGLLSACGAIPVDSGDEDAYASSRERFADCRSEALALDSSARAERAPAQYRASAQTMEYCVSEIAGNPWGRAGDDAMRLQALAVVNYLKGGDVVAAGAALDTFQVTFDGGDLYLEDYTSFTETIEYLLAQGGDESVTNDTANVSPQLKREIERTRYWLQH
jgi:hypothetical protein